jgi:hypothetical protein
VLYIELKGTVIESVGHVAGEPTSDGWFPDQYILQSLYFVLQNSVATPPLTAGD